MRISTNMTYSNSLKYMTRLQSNINRLTIQMATQQRINCPSDDPYGTEVALTNSTLISQLTQYQSNVDTAKGWLSLADDTLGDASTALASLIELAEQAATGTLTDANRLAIAEEARGLYEQLITYASTRYNGQSIFAGRDSGGTAYSLGLGTTVSGTTLASGAGSAVLSVEGEADQSIRIEFTGDGTVGTDDITYRYSSDGGDTWTEGTLAAGEATLACDGIQVHMQDGTGVSAVSDDDTSAGTRITVRPAAIYTGDADDGAQVTAQSNTDVTATPTGTFSNSVVVRMEDDTTVTGPVAYSYSTDGGLNWSDVQSSDNGTLTVPGGTLALSAGSGSDLAAGDTFIVSSDSTALTVRVSTSTSIAINSCGLDVFGGLYSADGESYAGTGDDDLFEAIGQFIGYLETNDAEGIAESLEAITAGQAKMLSAASNIGAREVRLEHIETANTLLTSTAKNAVSNVVDADTTELATQLSKLTTVYEAVLSTQAAVMKLSLLDYL
ncbi:flagellar hook-associated protein FlgL [Nitratidesulfovibrio sp. SRB-5]|uniref:flagellar hook-associated protein FlgL n=1 Tax=Nitratidesulfovibrio sp. SRB-5 TaxID=2872636 RepID=UPI0010251AA7|nr:flagellar hook-associated protein FlgL [Nitratidesulfovibrio sp. SRB-5]MBZ2172224.1 flagellar hook-associated protein FlgL [Nitratidesulfovibrio sp. SRB-5]RXF76091.1 flagellar hook-associated protein 3 [Desulfovibrio sp. DS-1]